MYVTELWSTTLSCVTLCSAIHVACDTPYETIRTIILIGKGTAQRGGYITDTTQSREVKCIEKPKRFRPLLYYCYTRYILVVYRANLRVLERDLASFSVESCQKRDALLLSPLLKRSQGQEGVFASRPKQHHTLRTFVRESVPSFPHRELGFPLLPVLAEHD